MEMIEHLMSLKYIKSIYIYQKLKLKFVIGAQNTKQKQNEEIDLVKHKTYTQKRKSLYSL